MLSVSTVTLFLSSLTVFAQILIVVSIVGFIWARKSKKQNLITNLISEYAFSVSFIVALTSMLGSLFYSDIAGYQPCLLCWYQRIAMYPQVLLLGLSLLRKDKNIAIYSVALSIIGAFLAFYHYLLQIGVSTIAPCGAVGYSISCSESFSMTFGYITIPMMALSAFILIITLLTIQKYQERNNIK